MQIDVSTRHGHISTETHEKIIRKLKKLSRFHERTRSARLTLDLQNETVPNVEVRVSVDRVPELVAHASGSSLWGAIDGALHKIEEQLRRQREKSIDHRVARRRLNDSMAVAEGETEEGE